MGLAFSLIDQLDRLGALHKGAAVLDVGSSNLYGATAEALTEFIEKYGGQTPDPEAVHEIAAGSEYSLTSGGKNEAWAGHMFELAGFSYLAFDIAKGYKTKIFDLNRDNLSTDQKGSFDLIINCGTTEHLIGQLNAFCVLHEATKPGGMMFHQLPHTGFMNHGYFTYTGRFFFDMAGYNKYEIVACWFEHAGSEPMLKCVEDYTTYFPALKETVQNAPAIDIPIVSINVLFRKTSARSFVAGLETSTSVVA